MSVGGKTITILGRSPLVPKGEDPEAAGLVQRVLSLYRRVAARHEVVFVEKKRDKKIVPARNT